jgi:hypothetical protein
MFVSLIVRLLRLGLRDKPTRLKMPDRYRVTLDLRRIRPASDHLSVPEWLLKMGFSPTTEPDVWKTNEDRLGRVPQNAILKAEKL